MGSGVARGIWGGCEASLKPGKRQPGLGLGKLMKVVRVKHVSEISATRVGMWPGEGSARAGCRKMVVPVSQPPGVFKDPSSRITLSRGVFTAHFEPLRVNYLLRPATRMPKRKADARPSAMVSSSYRSGSPNRPVPLSPIATFAFSLTFYSNSRISRLRNAFGHSLEKGR